MPQWATTIITVVCSVIASSGFWAFLTKRAEGRDAKTKMLIGLGHDRIVYLGMLYIQRGEITQDEFENLHDYLYKPYLELGGNGTAKRIMQEVEKLPIIRTIPERTRKND